MSDKICCSGYPNCIHTMNGKPMKMTNSEIKKPELTQREFELLDQALMGHVGKAERLSVIAKIEDLGFKQLSTRTPEPTKAEKVLLSDDQIETILIMIEQWHGIKWEIARPLVKDDLRKEFFAKSENGLVRLDECKIQRILAKNKKLIFSERYLLSKEICETLGSITKEQLLAILPEKIYKVPGMGCICLALGECECGCDADWTDYETWNKYHDIMKQRIEELFK